MIDCVGVELLSRFVDKLAKKSRALASPGDTGDTMASISSCSLEYNEKLDF